MILTKTAIREAHEKGEILIEPFKSSHLNPNSYNYRLHNILYRVEHISDRAPEFEQIVLTEKGFVLQPRALYLAATYEIIGSTKYVMTLLGRSSIGRLGLFLNITADLGHVGSISRWTLELTVVQPLRVYPYMRVGQVAFWNQHGKEISYKGRYHKDLKPVWNKDPSLFNPWPRRSIQ